MLWDLSLQFQHNFPRERSRKGLTLKLHVDKECNLHEEVFRMMDRFLPLQAHKSMPPSTRMAIQSCQKMLGVMVYHWVWRQSLGPVSAFDFLHGLQGLLKHWRKRTLQSLIWVGFWGLLRVRCALDGGRGVVSSKRHGHLSNVYLLVDKMMWVYSFNVVHLPSGNQTWQWKIPELNGSFNGKIADKWSIFHCQVLLP